MDIDQSAFRIWVHQLWVQNCEERQLYGDSDRLTKQQYWHRFRWWLRREWRHRQQCDSREPTALEFPRRRSA